MPKPILVSFRGQAFKSKLTVAAGAKSYVAGDVICGTGNAMFTFGSSLFALNDNDGMDSIQGVLSGRAAEGGRSVQLNGLRLTISSAITPFDGEFWIFDRAISITDDAAFAPSLTELEDYVLIKVPFVAANWTSFAARAQINVDNIDKLMMYPDPGNYSLVTGQAFGVMVSRASTSWAGSETIAAQINVTKD
jgi:hypothetical protein